MTLTSIALIDLSANYLLKEGYLHTFVSKDAHIIGSGVVILICHAVRTIEVSLKHPEFKSIGVHLFQKVFDVAIGKLPAAHKLVIVADVRILLAVIVFFIGEIFTEVFS